jgi:hypothetical protein
MRLEECDTDVDLVSTAPFQRSEPEPEWVEANQKGIIPDSLFRLYARSKFLSFGSAPDFLRDKDHHIFSYFSLMLRGIKSNLVDADEDLRGFVEAEGKVYDFGKGARNEPWEPTAHLKSKKHFRLVLLSLFSSLDCLAEVIALILPDSSHKVRIGRADFTDVEHWLKTELSTSNLILTPVQVKVRELHDALRPIVLSSGEEEDWFPFARLLRNKSAHLGTEQFRELGFSNKDKVFYTFLPTKWPLLWEEYIKLSGVSREQDDSVGMDRMIASLMRQDKVSYLVGLRAKVMTVVDSAVKALDSSYLSFQDFEVNVSLAEKIRNSSQEFAFKAFHDSAG